MYRRRGERAIKNAEFVILDLICLNIALLMSYYVISGNQLLQNIRVYFSLAFVSTFINLVLYVFLNEFYNVMHRNLTLEIYNAGKQAVVLTAFMDFYLTINIVIEHEKKMIVITGAIYWFLTVIGRELLKQYLKEYGKIAKKVSIVLITDVANVSSIAETLQSGQFGYDIAAVSFVGNTVRQKHIGKIPVIPYGDQMVGYLCRNWVDEVFIDYCVPREESAAMTAELSTMGVVVHQRFHEQREGQKGKKFIEMIGDYSVITSTLNYSDTLHLMLKRTVDIIGGLVGSLIALILMLILCPIIKIESPGPLFYKQERVGMNGRRFYILKFRSMYMDADERKKELMEKNQMDSDFMFKLDEDPRIIGSRILPDGTYKKGIGNLIRDWSLDEFPQFINVLKGEMSLVGTRPPTVDEWNKYELHHRARMAAKPGITGMWQTSGRSNITDFEEVVRLDTKYINEWSFTLDLEILLKTIKVVLKRDGSM